ncbi:MAG: DUF3467 domain-containing protein [Candidatus Woesearchaeota archaeon]|jgi:hypothetical protein|nr:DUF3467 domain-containing protein [Candidatus Woesearchaeota archaeon]MDP7506044.1 DUF3467 domain-containing protein [Candidatus Woesearchaeota archaeon]MDP7610522.1 DUF3467 domain-containing protein [Candidatus Woesearchaeota archaeon]|tara:strand:+ start:1069 stop:1422 length:354 start_codon:yes stop_codon:yes gene_type:complete
MEEKKVNFGVSSREPFFAHETSVNFNPTQFVLDFKCVTPLTDISTKEVPMISIKHNTIMLDPYHTKEVYKLLSRVIEKYEKEFGKIEKPKALLEFEKKHKKKNKADDNKIKAPSYLG